MKILPQKIMNRSVVFRNSLLLLFLIVVLLGLNQLVDAREISGSGVGIINCLTNSKHISASLSIIAFENISPMYGSWEVIANNESVDSFSNSGYLSDGNIQNSGYQLNGVETHNNICNANTPSNVIISGSCGSDGKLQIKGEKWSAYFDGNIMCHIELNEIS